MTNYQRINRVMKFYYNRGQNRESVNSVFRKIIKQRLDAK
jgi:hypothetical protein